jgi:hypothetical protein
VTDPSTLAAAFYYPGRDDLTASWRTEAQARINATRTTRLSIPMVDINGRPVKGALINVYQQHHQFGFRSALRASLLLSNPTYAGTFTSTTRLTCFLTLSCVVIIMLTPCGRQPQTRWRNCSM